MAYSINSVLVDSEQEALTVALGDFLYGAGLNAPAYVATMDPAAALVEVRDADLLPLHVTIVATGEQVPIHAPDDLLLSIIIEIIQEARQS